MLSCIVNRDTTALGDDLAIPHGKSDAVNDIGIAVVRVKEPMDWEGIDGPSRYD